MPVEQGRKGEHEIINDASVLTGWCGSITIEAGRQVKIVCGGDWCLVVPLVFKTSVGPIRSRVGSIPIRLRHLLSREAGVNDLAVTGRYKEVEQAAGTT